MNLSRESGSVAGPVADDAFIPRSRLSVAADLPGSLKRFTIDYGTDGLAEWGIGN